MTRFFAESRRGRAVNDRRGVCWLSLVIVIGAAFASAARAQDGDAETKGVDSGNYNVQQTIEFGYRANEVNGNQDTYDTFINLGSGVRLFDYTLDMRSLNHNGLLFDDLNFSNFGYGGDPNDVSRLHIDKNKWYDFHLLFRRDKNFWDYNLFANPFNPAALNPVGSETTGCIVSPPSAAHPGLPGYCSNPAIAEPNSPHAMDLVRRMQDYDLTLLPESRVRFRLGFSHDRDQGPGFFTTDSGTVPDFPENYSYTTNAYRAGVDFRVLPRTTISYDEFLSYFKQDNVVTENPAATPGQYGYQLSNGTPVDLGIVWSTQTPAEALPCAFSATSPVANAATSPPTANANCNGFLSYSQVGRPRNYMPTERLRFQSNYFQKFQMSGSVGYSSSDNSIPDFDEILNGFVTRTATRVSTTAGPAKATRVSVNADWAGTYAVTEKFRLEDSFRYDNWRIPGFWATAETNVFGAAGSGQVGLLLPLSLFNQVSPGAATFHTLCPTAPYNQAGCPLHTTGSGADVTNELSYQFLGQNLKSNTFQLQYDFTKRLSGRIGYLYTNRTIAQFSATFDVGETYFPGGAGATSATDYFAARGDCAFPAAPAPHVLPAGCTLNSDGSITEGSPTDLVPEAGNDTARQTLAISENALLAGITARPIDNLRITGDLEFGYNDNSFTRIDPRQVESYKVHATYTPKPWATVDGAVEIHENRDNVTTVDNLEHDRMYSFTTMLMPNPRVTIDFGYNYWDIYSQSEICFNYSVSYTNPPPATGTTVFQTSPPGVNTTACPVVGASVGAAGLGALSTYSSNDHFVHAGLMWKPAKRVTTSVGYAGSFVRGNTIFLNPLAPSGTLDYNYQMPYGSVRIDLYRGFSYKMAWNYYGFNQEGDTNPFGLGAIPLQDFNGSTATFSFLYSF
jgi:hypothetical protein